jgi:hypothetical protein
METETLIPNASLPSDPIPYLPKLVQGLVHDCNNALTGLLCLIEWSQDAGPQHAADMKTLALRLKDNLHTLGQLHQPAAQAQYFDVTRALMLAEQLVPYALGRSFHLQRSPLELLAWGQLHGFLGAMLDVLCQVALRAHPQSTCTLGPYVDPGSSATLALQYCGAAPELPQAFAPYTGIRDVACFGDSKHHTLTFTLYHEPFSL